MKIKIPLFIIGLLVLLTSYSGMTASIETFLFTTYGFLILLLSFKIDLKTFYPKSLNYENADDNEDDDMSNEDDKDEEDDSNDQEDEQE